MSPRRGHFLISDRGREVLKAPPARIDIKFLEQYPEFIEFRTPKGEDREPACSRSLPEAADADTPEEALEAAHAKMKASLASEVLGASEGWFPGFLRAARG